MILFLNTAPHGVGCPSHNVQRTKPNETHVTAPMRRKTGQVVTAEPVCTSLCVRLFVHCSVQV